MGTLASPQHRGLHLATGRLGATGRFLVTRPYLNEMGAGAADIAEVVSDVKERLPDLSPPAQLDSPEQARTSLVELCTLRQAVDSINRRYFEGQQALFPQSSSGLSGTGGLH